MHRAARPALAFCTGCLMASPRPRLHLPFTRVAHIMHGQNDPSADKWDWSHDPET